MGGRGATLTKPSESSQPFSVPKIGTALLKALSRKDMEAIATAIYANNAMKSGLTKAEGVQRAMSLMSGNTDAQLRKYIAKNAK